MLDFYNNTYYIAKGELPEVIEILKRHSEYKGYKIRTDMDINGFNLDKYDTLWQLLEDYADVFASKKIYLDNSWLTAKMVNQNLDMIRLTQAYCNGKYTMHNPQSLITTLKYLDRQVLILE